MFWNIQDKTGTLYSSHDTHLGHLLQHCYWMDNFGDRHNLDFAYTNIMAILTHNIQMWGDTLHTIDCAIVEEDDSHYCSLMTSDKYENKEDLNFRWGNCFDLMLHDAAVTYTYLAAKTDQDAMIGQYKLAEGYATIAASLWGLSRQLRVDLARK